ncbi:MAG: SpoIIE family protein phosphatase [Clostridia bacterium]|nr:SpoIIE family protein phosphatase [Clostridia bacterium]
MRFGISKKLLLLIAALSLALIAASVVVSSRLYASSLKREAKKLCEETADSLAESITNERIDFMNGFKSKIEAAYLANREELEAASGAEFESFEKREEFYERFTEGIFPPKQGLGLSYEAATFKLEYQNLLDSMDMLSYAGGLDVASVFFYDAEHGSIVYLVDRQPEGSTLYNFPASVSKPRDAQLKEALETLSPTAYVIGTKCVAATPVDGTDGTVFVLFASYNAETETGVRLFSLYTLLMLLGATALIGAFILMFANRLIVRNVRKLSAAAEAFTSQIDGGSPERISAGISSRDEIGDLSGKFDLMQGAILGYARTLEEKTSREERMKAELGLAARIQEESLPHGSLRRGGAELTSFLKPAKEVGGDLYDYFMLDDRRMFFCLADVSGKGIPASLFMMRASALIKSGVAQGKPLSRFAFDLNNELCSGNEESIFITAFFGVLDTLTGRLEFLRAGHEEPFLRRAGGITRLGRESNYVLGVFDDADFLAEETTLSPGDTLFMFTDGLDEGVDPDNEAFGYDRIAGVLGASADDVNSAMYSALVDFCRGAEQFDDVTMLTLRVSGLTLRFPDPGYADIAKASESVLRELSAFPKERVSEAGVIVDEIMNNEITYGLAEAEDPLITLTLRVEGDTAVLMFEDNGAAFDPLTDVTPEALENSEGGFGILFVKSLSDSRAYVREGGLNRLTVKKNMV